MKRKVARMQLPRWVVSEVIDGCISIPDYSVDSDRSRRRRPPSQDYQYDCEKADKEQDY